MGQGFFVGVRHASNHNDESFQTSALELRLDQVKHESEQLRLNILEKDKIIDGKAAITTTEVLLHFVTFFKFSDIFFLSSYFEFACADT